MKRRSDIQDVSRQDERRHTDHARGRTAIFAVRVIPGATRNEIVGVQGDSLKVKVTASPVKGKANEALVKLLAKTLGVRKNQIEIVSGLQARRKMVRVEGLEKNSILHQIRNRCAKS